MISRTRLGTWTAMVACGICCLVAGLLGGPGLLRMTIAVIALLAAMVAYQNIPRPMSIGPGPYPRPRTPPASGYPRYQEIVHHLSWSAESPAYRRNVLEPWLAGLAEDLGATPPEPTAQPDDVIARLEREVCDEGR